VIGVKISEILKTNQPKIHKALSKKSGKKRSRAEKLTERDIKELMGHSSYKKVSGAVRQVRP